MKQRKIVFTFLSFGALLLSACNSSPAVSSSSSGSSGTSGSSSVLTSSPSPTTPSPSSTPATSTTVTSVPSISSEPNSSSATSSSSSAPATVTVNGDPAKYDSQDIADPISSVADNPDSTDGYKYGRSIFDNYMAQEHDYSYSLREDFGKGFMPSHGTSKMLVVPVMFAESTESDAEQDDMRASIYRTFFGDADQTGWESVRSYYYEASYHQLYLEGAVAPFVKLPVNYSSYAAHGTSSTNTILYKVYKALFTGDNPIYKVSDFDSNGDGVIDSIYLINDQPVGEDLSWAFTTWYQNGLTATPLGSYAWSSYYFSNRKAGYSVEYPDAHTYIHETGHIMGLNDYYDTYNSYRSPAGGESMQDYNICDHESYSKYLWGWTSPKVITDKNTEDSIEVTLKPFESSGDSVLLAGNFNGTSLDEYLMIDYYTPTGLAEKDSTTKYETLKGLTIPGIRIWHVDKRVYEAYLDTSDITSVVTYFDPNQSEDPVFSSDLDPSTDRIEYYTDFSTNSSKYQSDSNFYIHDELHLMKATYGTSAYSIDTATDADLFQAGDTFGASGDAYSDFEFYAAAGELPYDCTSADYDSAAKVQLPYSIKVESVGDTAKLVFTRKA